MSHVLKKAIEVNSKNIANLSHAVFQADNDYLINTNLSDLMAPTVVSFGDQHVATLAQIQREYFASIMELLLEVNSEFKQRVIEEPVGFVSGAEIPVYDRFTDKMIYLETKPKKV